MSNVYVLLGQTGEYGDHMEWIVRVYADKGVAGMEAARLTELAKVDSVNDFHRDYQLREAAVARLRQHDAQARMDDTGTAYWVAEVPFVEAS